MPSSYGFFCRKEAVTTNVKCLGSAENCCLLNSLLSFNQDTLCSLLLQTECSSSLNSGEIDKPMEVCNRQQFSQARWMAEAWLSRRYSMLPLLQGDYAISQEFTSDMIIAVKLQPTTNNCDGRWQVKCACLPITALHTHSRFISQRINAIYTPTQLFKVPRSSSPVPSTHNCCADCGGGGVIKCFVRNRELSPLCKCVFLYTPVTHL